MLFPNGNTNNVPFQQYLDGVATKYERLQIQHDRFSDGTTDDELTAAYVLSRAEGITIDEALRRGRIE